MLRNLNPDVTGKINESIGDRDDPVATDVGNHSIISLIRRGISLLTVPSKAKQSRHRLLPGKSTTLVLADTSIKEIIIYNIGFSSTAICLGKEIATEEAKSYSLAPKVLVIEAFSGMISAIAEHQTEVIVTVKS